MFQKDASTGGGLQFDPNYTAGQVSGTQRAGGGRSISRQRDIYDSLDKHINSALAERFSELTINDRNEVLLLSVEQAFSVSVLLGG